MLRFHEFSRTFHRHELANALYHCVPRVKREPRYTLIDFVEAAKSMENWVGLESCSGQLK